MPRRPLWKRRSAPPSPWTPAEDEALRGLWSSGAMPELWRGVVDRSVGECVERAAELGLAPRNTL